MNIIVDVVFTQLLENVYTLIRKIQSQENTHFLRGAVKKNKKQYIYRHCPNRREGGQPHFKKLKINDFLTKVGVGGGHKNIFPVGRGHSQI